MLDNIKIGRKLIGGFIFVALIAGVIGGAGYYGLGTTRVSYDLVTENYLPSVIALATIDEAQTAVTVGERGLINRQMMDSELRQAQYDYIDAAWTRVDTAWQNFESHELSAEEQALWNTFTPQWNKWKADHNEVRRLQEEKDRLVAAGVSLDDPKITELDEVTFEASLKTRDSFLESEAALKKLIDFNRQAAIDADLAADALSNQIKGMIIVAIVVGVIAALGLGFYLSRSVTTPLAQTVHMIQEMNLGRLGGRLRMARKDEVGVMARAMDSFANDLQHVVLGTMQKIADGDLSVTLAPRDSQDEIAPALNKTLTALRGLVAEAQALTRAAVEGKLAARGNAGQFQGGYRDIVQGVNDTLDSVIGPLNVAAEYLDRIAKGDIPQPIKDSYNGDFNEIKLNLNICIEAVNLLVSDTNLLVEAATGQRFAVRVDASRHQGDFRKVVQGVNDTLDVVVDKMFWYEQLLNALPFPLSVTDMDMNWTFVNKATEGFLGVSGHEVIGKQCSNWNANICRTDQCGIARLRQNKPQTDFAQFGKDFQVDTSYILNARGERVGHIEVVQETSARTKVAAYQKVEVQRLAHNLRQLANGDLSFATVVSEGDEYTRDVRENFISINQSLEGVKAAVNALVVDTTTLAQAGVEGRLATRADATRHGGEFRKVVQGVNETLDAVIGPLTTAADYVDRIARGEVPESIRTGYQGDFERFKDNLNRLSDSLRDMLGGIKEAVNNLSAAAAEILAATTQQASGASEQSAAIAQTSTTIDEVKAIVEQSLAKAQAVAEQAQRTREVAATGQRAVSDTVESMGQIKEKVEGIAENILALSEQTQQIGEITATVNEIASQSNLLALNASVEAARAGEHGKGFAVVAVEVRNLAEQSKQATAQVKAILNEIQRATNAAVMATEEGTKGVDGGVQRAGQAGDTIQQMGSVIAENASAAQQVVASAQQQTTGMEQIALAMQNINQATVQSLASTRQAEKAAQDLSALARQMEALVARYRLSGATRTESEPGMVQVAGATAGNGKVNGR